MSVFIEGIPIANFLKGNEIVLPKIKELLSSGKVVVIDGCFYHKEQIKHFIQNLNFDHYVFTLKASLSACIERDSGRSQVYGEGAATAVHNLVSRFDYGVVIETEGKSCGEVVEEAVEHIGGGDV